MTPVLHVVRSYTDSNNPSGKWLVPGDHSRPHRGDFLALRLPSTRFSRKTAASIPEVRALTDLCVRGLLLVLTGPKGRSTEVSGWSVV